MASPVIPSLHGLVGRTTSSAEGVCLVMAFAKAGGSFRHVGEGSLLERLKVSIGSRQIQTKLGVN